MIRWEYHFRYIHAVDDIGQLTDIEQHEIDGLGREGWELVTVRENLPDFPHEFVFKRPYKLCKVCDDTEDRWDDARELKGFRRQPISLHAIIDCCLSASFVSFIGEN